MSFFRRKKPNIKTPNTFYTKFHDMLNKRGFLHKKRADESIKGDILKDLKELENLLETHEKVKNREEFSRSHRRIHTVLRRLFVRFKQIKDFKKDEHKLEVDDQLIYLINSWSGRILNRPIRSNLGLGLKAITRPELDSEFFFPAQDDITIATPVYATVPNAHTANARYVRDDKRNTRASARTRKAKNLATLTETPSELYATAAPKYPLARYSRRNPYNETPHSKSRRKYSVARSQHNASNLERHFHRSRPGKNHLNPENYKGTAF